MGPDYLIRSEHNNLFRTISYRPSILRPHDFYVYPQSATTTVAAYINRHRPQLLPEYDAGLFQDLRHLRRFQRRPKRWTRQEYADSYRDPGKRRFYTRVAEDLDSGRKKLSASVKPHTKMEKMSSTKYKAPRLIQARDPTFNVEYGRYIKPLERATKSDIHIGKGNFDEVGRKIHKLSKRYKFYTECDHSTFDAHITVEMLKLTHRFYQSCYPDDPVVCSLSARTIFNRCYTRNGESYTVLGTRMSGDVDTSFGNSLLNYHIIKTALDEAKIDGDVVVQGDDSIIFTNIPLGDVFAAQLRRFNMESKLSPSTTNIHTVEYCASKLVYDNEGRPTMAADPERIADRFGFCFRPYDQRTYSAYLAAVSHCNWCLTKNTPACRIWKRQDAISLKRLRLLEADELFFVHEETDGVRQFRGIDPTPSMIEAWPGYDWNRQVIEYKLPPDQKRTIINHESKELIQY